MKYLNAAQFAFVLDITKDEARAKMCVAWSKAKGIYNAAAWEKKDPYGKEKLVDPYPPAMEIDMLSRQLNLPTLQESCDDIAYNYLNRPGSRKWILCDFPEKAIKRAADAGKTASLKIPPALESMLPTTIKVQILDEWRARYPLVNISNK